MTPERATRYVAETLPDLIARAAAQLGEGPPPAGGTSAKAARLALLSAREVVDALGDQVPEATLLPLDAALARLERRFRDLHPQLPLAIAAEPARPADLAQLLAAAWDAAPEAAGPPAAAPPGPGLPTRGAGLDL